MNDELLNKNINKLRTKMVIQKVTVDFFVLGILVILISLKLCGYNFYNLIIVLIVVFGILLIISPYINEFLNKKTRLNMFLLFSDNLVKDNKNTKNKFHLTVNNNISVNNEHYKKIGMSKINDFSLNIEYDSNKIDVQSVYNKKHPYFHLKFISTFSEGFCLTFSCGKLKQINLKVSNFKQKDLNYNFYESNKSMALSYKWGYYLSRDIISKEEVELVKNLFISLTKLFHLEKTKRYYEVVLDHGFVRVFIPYEYRNKIIFSKSIESFYDSLNDEITKITEFYLYTIKQNLDPNIISNRNRLIKERTKKLKAFDKKKKEELEDD